VCLLSHGREKDMRGREGRKILQRKSCRKAINADINDTRIINESQTISSLPIFYSFSSMLLQQQPFSAKAVILRAF
jgi:hypothetical protein